uniref:Probable pectate lyase F n=1 Tax=Meloidogyne hapla TaxID=6305 RepID=A0A1I8BA06_MELHA
MNIIILFIFIFLIFFESYLFLIVKWPRARQTYHLEDTKPVDKYLDCGYDRYVPNVNNGKWGNKREFMKPVFQLQNGAVIKGCIFSGVDGIHCNGSCIVEDCWNEDVGDDSISLMGYDRNSNYLIQGGGAMLADGKVVQLDGAGTLTVNNFYINTAGQCLRSCGNCLKQVSQRKIYVNNLIVENLQIGQYVVGVNKNYEDQATLKNIHIYGKKANETFPCKVFEGNDYGGNPKVLIKENKTRGDGKYCIYGPNDIHINSSF